MGFIYGYKGKFWKPIYEFSYKGEPEEFSLKPGRYLLMCNGAQGGSWIKPINYGGSSYGILDLKEETTMYAVVGGNGTYTGDKSKPGIGGYNGGGNGSLSYELRHESGCGGGGASDIRLSNKDTEMLTFEHFIPDEFVEVEYIESDRTQYIDTGVIHKANTRIECICEITQDDYDTWEVLFGSRDTSMTNQLVFFSRFSDQDVPCYGRGTSQVSGTGLTYGTKIKIVIDGSTASWYNMDGTLLGSVTNNSTQTDGKYSMFLFDMHNGTSGADESKSIMKLYSFKMLINNEPVCYMVPFREKGNPIDFSKITWEPGIIDQAGPYDDPTYIRTSECVPLDPSTPYVRCVVSTKSGKEAVIDFVACDANKEVINSYYWHDNGTVWGMPEGTAHIRFCLRYADEFIDFPPSDVDKFECVCFPSLDIVSGMYDLCNDTVHTSPVGNNFMTGSVVDIKTQHTTYEEINVGLLSRIIVAGGGGGSTMMSAADTGKADYCGFGGGIYGGPAMSNDGDPNSLRYATQETGHSFGIGMTPPNKTSTSNYGGAGSSGGGGGWFGGYAPASNGNITFSQGNGGGGSGYVLTESSYKPDGYTPDERYYLTDTLMTCGSAYEASVIVCIETDIYNSGDTIVFPCLGEMGNDPYKLFPGKYRVKCWGGDGGCRVDSATSARGGYSEGVFHNPDINDMYVHVGGSGLWGTISAAYTSTALPTIGINGGGKPYAYTNVTYGGAAGGGGTDVRIGSDSLYARLIVAGGAGGMGRYKGGAGGGEVGSKHEATGYGTNAGPGTQTEAPVNSKDSKCSGSFGSGGNSVKSYGGAGGGGWFGGSATYPDSSGDDDFGGSGGSGYVLTESSYRPTLYELGEEFWMTETLSVNGGNNLPYGHTKVEIDVIVPEIANMICRDDEGYKYFNTDQNKWVYLSPSKPTVEDFEKYGTLRFLNDDGLGDEFDVFIHDIYDSCDSVKFNVIPNKQIIKTTAHTDMMVSRLTSDMDVDKENVDVNITSNRHGIAENACIDLSIEVDMKEIPDIETRLYCIQAYSQGKASEYHERKDKIKTLEHIDLLPVGIGNRMPSRYKSYLGGFLDGDVAISSATNALSCERHRNIYTCVLCNDTTLRFVKLNLITNKSEIIKDIPKSSVGNTYYGDMLVDDEYIYLSPATNESRVFWRIPLDPNDNTVKSFTQGSSKDHYFTAFGKMEWLNDKTIIIGYVRGFLLFDTKSYKFTRYQSPTMNSTRQDIAIGKHLAITIYRGDSSSYWAWDMDTNTWYTGEDLGATYLTTSPSVACYNDGKFYITQKNYLYILDEETRKIEKTIVTPYASLNPKSINYASGVLYITIESSRTLYMYDTRNDKFISTALPFTINGWASSGWCRPVSFRGYFFVPNIRLYVINFVEYAKYNMGYKYDQYMFIMNKEHEPEYDYDDRFVTFTDTHVLFHTGDITKPVEIVDEVNRIKKINISKSEYKKFLDLRLVENNEESEDDTNGDNI